MTLTAIIALATTVGAIFGATLAAGIAWGARKRLAKDFDELAKTLSIACRGLIVNTGRLDLLTVQVEEILSRLEAMQSHEVRLAVIEQGRHGVN